MKRGTYAMVPERISTVYFIHPQISLCVCMCIPLQLLGNCSIMNFTATTNTYGTIEDLNYK